MRKKTSTTVTEASAQSILRRGSVRQLDATEEKAMRMRLGAGLPRSGELEWLGTEDEEREIEIRALEIETWMKMRAHQARKAAAPSHAAVAPKASRTKEKIVRALRRRGPTR
jgi:hypothetical protein